MEREARGEAIWAAVNSKSIPILTRIAPAELRSAISNRGNFVAHRLHVERANCLYESQDPWINVHLHLSWEHCRALMKPPISSDIEEHSAGDPRIAEEVSLVRGGPFYRVQEISHLVTGKRWNLGRRVALAIGLSWLPLVVITLLSKPQTIGGLLTDYAVNVRMVIAVPVLLAGQILMESTFAAIVRHIREAELLSSSEQVKMDLTIGKLIRLRDSVVAEVIVVVIAYLHLATVFHLRRGIASDWAVSSIGNHLHWSPAGWYYALVCLLLYQFLVGISLWKWVIAICFLFRLSRLDLQLVPTHPDHHGGLGFLGMSPAGIAPTIFVGCIAIGSTWRTEILMHEAHLLDFKIDAMVLLAIVLVIAMGPLVFFVPRLVRLRRQGILQYGILGQIQSTEFHKKWILNRKGHEDDLLAAPEVSTMIDYSASYDNIEKLLPFPIDLGALFWLILAIVVPILPVVLAEIPFISVMKGLLNAVK